VEDDALNGALKGYVFRDVNGAAFVYFELGLSSHDNHPALSLNIMQRKTCVLLLQVAQPSSHVPLF